MTEREIAITVRGLSKRYTRGPENGWTLQQVFGDVLTAPYRKLRGLSAPVRPHDDAFWALKDLSFDVARGERVAIIGRNGAGKSTFLKILSRVVYPTEGEARIRGRVTSLLEVGTGFNSNLTGRLNVYQNASMHGLSRAETEARFDAIVEFAQIGPFIDTPIKRYSTGMRARLAFAVAAHLDPDILIMDEVLAVGDLAFQRKCLQRVEGMAEGDTTLLFVSHSMDAVVRFCTRGIWLEGGRIVADGPVRDVAAAYVNGVLEVKSQYVHHPAVNGAAAHDAGDVSDDGAALDAAAGDHVHSTAPNTGGHERDATATALVAAPVTATPEADVPEADVRLVGARVVSRQGLSVSVVPMDEEVGVKIDYTVAGRSVLLLPCLFLNAPDGTLVFAAVPPETDTAAMTHAPGRHSATVWLPAHFLNAGQYTIGLALAGPDEAPLRRYVQVEEALSFLSVEPRHGGARGLMPRGFPGVLRPTLDWHLQHG